MAQAHARRVRAEIDAVQPAPVGRPPRAGRATVRARANGKGSAADAPPLTLVSDAPRPPRRRQPESLAVRAAGARPDRLAMWAVMLGLFLALLAATTARADAEPATPAADPPAQTATL